MTRAFPTSIRNRPFAVEPTTGTMLPDGIFDASLRLLEITCFYTNDSGRLMSHGFVRLPSKVAPGIRLAKPHWFEFKNLLPGASVRMSFLCDFTEAMASKPEVRFEVGGSYADGTMETGFGFDGYIRKVIWVSKTTYDSVSRQYRCEVPEGALTLLATRSEWSRPFQITSREGVVTTIQLPVPVSFGRARGFGTRLRVELAVLRSMVEGGRLPCLRYRNDWVDRRGEEWQRHCQYRDGRSRARQSS